MLEQRRNILITGGTGSLGSALVARWYGHHNLTVLSRDWLKQSKMRQLYPDISYTLADICNYDAVYQACKGQGILIHAAAIKDVAYGEQHPTEIARVNIQGSEIVARAWANAKWSVHPTTNLFPLEPRKALLISTDKAPSAINGYGSSKFLAERIFLAFGYGAIRYGNVISSNGSFLQVWKALIESGQPIIARDPNPTRFALSLSQAVDLVEDALSQPPGIYAPHSLPAFSLADVVEVFRRRYDCTVHYEGLLKGEKQHEVLISEGEKAMRASDLLAEVVHRDYAGLYNVARERLNSATAPRLGREEIEAWLS